MESTMKQMLFEGEKNLSDKIEDIAEGVDSRCIHVPYTDEEISSFKDCLAQACIEMNKVERQEAEYKAAIKAMKTPLEQDIKTYAGKIDAGGVDKYIRCYKIVDRELGKVGYYDDEGVLREERDATEEEMQNPPLFPVQPEQEPECDDNDNACLDMPE